MLTIQEEGMGLAQARRILAQYGIAFRLLTQGNGKNSLTLNPYWPIEVVEAVICCIPDSSIVHELRSMNSPNTIQRVSFLKNLQKLEIISLSNSPLCSQELNLSSLAQLLALETLQMSNCRLRLANLKTLQNASLKRLDLSGNTELGNDSLEVLASNLPNLESISINATRISQSEVQRVFGEEIKFQS